MFKPIHFMLRLLTRMFGRKHDDDEHDDSREESSTERLLIRELIHELREDRKLIRRLLALLEHIVPRPTHVRIRFIRNPQGDPMADPITIVVGQTVAAKVEVLDQNGAVMPGFDFAANPPSFTSDSAVITLGAGSSPDVSSVTGANAGAATLTVVVPGVANGTESAVVTVTAPASVPTSVRLTFA